MKAVTTTGLVKRFESKVAVAGIDLSLDPGEIRGLLGPNGAGKTTLMRMLLGLVTPDAGTIELFGRHSAGPGSVDLDGVAGFVEAPSFYPYLTGRANLEVLAQFDSGNSALTIDAALERIGLAQRADDRVNGYSTGMRQRLGIAAALIRSPRLLLLDEPTSGLDPDGARQLGRLIQELASDGVSVLLSSHQIGEIEDICHTFTVMNRGSVVWDGTPDDVRDQASASEFGLHTADDRAALAMARSDPAVTASPTPGGSLRVTASQPAIDAFVIALGREGIAVRSLELVMSPLEAMFFSLTSDGPPAANGRPVQQTTESG